MKRNAFTKEDFEQMQALIGYRFSDTDLLAACFTHKTYSNARGGEDNERLEFLGDAVLQLCVTEQLYLHNRNDEGKLTELRQQLVSQSALECAVKRAGLMPFLRYMGGEQNVGGKTASNLFEAVIGGIYLDGGIEPVKLFLKRYLTAYRAENYRTLLQEFVQERIKKMPDYRVREENGSFFCKVTAMGLSAEGSGESKKSAEMQAAKALYFQLTEGTEH